MKNDSVVFVQEIPVVHGFPLFFYTNESKGDIKKSFLYMRSDKAVTEKPHNRYCNSKSDKHKMPLENCGRKTAKRLGILPVDCKKEGFVVHSEQNDGYRN